MYLADTNVMSESRKESRANKGVRDLFERERRKNSVHLSIVVIAEIRRGVEMCRRRGDSQSASIYGKWLDSVKEEYKQRILPVDKAIGELWGRLRVPHAEPALDKLIAATAIVHGLTVVTRNVKDFEGTDVKVLNPFD
jgi:toxin FitB